MARKWHPVIEEKRCTRCGACIERCTHGVYRAGTNIPHVENKAACVACMACQRVCPENAITYTGDVIGDVGCGCSKASR